MRRPAQQHPNTPTTAVSRRNTIPVIRGEDLRLIRLPALVHILSNRAGQGCGGRTTVYLECLQTASRLTYSKYDGYVGSETSYLAYRAMCPFADLRDDQATYQRMQELMAGRDKATAGCLEQTDILIESRMGRVPRGLLAGRTEEFFGRETGRLILIILDEGAGCIGRSCGSAPSWTRGRID